MGSILTQLDITICSIIDKIHQFTSHEYLCAHVTNLMHLMGVVLIVHTSYTLMLLGLLNKVIFVTISLWISSTLTDNKITFSLLTKSKQTCT